MVRNAAASVIGLPHSGHSGGVSGRLSSSMVFSTSTNGTSATMPANSSGARLATAPISMPPALPPWPTILPAAVYLLCDQRARRRLEVGEGVGLLLALAVEVPAPALVRAAAHVGDGIDEAAVDQREAVGRERRRHRHAIGAVAVEQERRAAVPRQVAPVQDRDRHLGAVVRGRHDARRDVVRRDRGRRGSPAACARCARGSPCRSPRLPPAWSSRSRRSAGSWCRTRSRRRCRAHRPSRRRRSSARCRRRGRGSRSPAGRASAPAAPGGARRAPGARCRRRAGAGSARASARGPASRAAPS